MNRNLCVDTTWLARAVLSSLGLLPITAGGCSGQTVDRSAGTTGGTDATVPCDRPERLATGLERCGAGGPVHRNATEVCSAKDLSGVMLGCLTDADCDAGKLCRCGTSGGVCFPADCRTDADCGANLRCQMFDHDICSSQFFTCQTADDTCETDADCVGTVLGGGGSVGIMLTQHCDSRGGPFRCEPSGCTVGRPFLVEGRERLAPAAVRSDWLADLPSDVEQLPEEIRALAAAGWVAIARMEHASVAAFARFALQLLELGAPPWLIERATSAMADETRHAKLAFALGSKLAGQPVGPGPLAMDGSMVSLTLPEVVCLVFREGCVGETGAALEARLASTHVAQPGLEQLLLGIADDETRHAQLAWQFVGWALTVDPRGAGEALRRELERAKCEVVVANSDEPHAAALKRFGLVSAAERAELRHQVLRDVVVPCTERLLAGLRPEAPSRSPSAGAP